MIAPTELLSLCLTRAEAPSACVLVRLPWLHIHRMEDEAAIHATGLHANLLLSPDVIDGLKEAFGDRLVDASEQGVGLRVPAADAEDAAHALFAHLMTVWPSPRA